MKILIVNTSDIEGGAARAAFRLHESLLAENINSQMLVMNKLSDLVTILSPLTTVQKGLVKFRPFLDSLFIQKYKNKNKNKALFSPARLPFSGIAGRINKINPDIVHLHWVTGGMLRIEELAKIKAPIVWSLHDMWPFTGGCHYNEGCIAYKDGCGACKVLGSEKEKDLSRKIFLIKKQTYLKKQDITVIGLSRWLAAEAKSSSLFSNYKVITLPNPIDTTRFAPYNKTSARQLLNLPLDKKIILFGAVSATSDPRKGFKELSQTLREVNNIDTELVIFGSSQPVVEASFSQKAHYLGRLHDDVTLRALYSAADVMIVPSLEENLSNVIMESLSCGTPVVGFNIGGNSDLIDHQVNGYLAEPYNTSDLAKGIDWVLDSKKISNSARDKILIKFDSNIVAKQYIELYRGILGK